MDQSLSGIDRVMELAVERDVPGSEGLLDLVPSDSYQLVEAKVRSSRSIKYNASC